MKFNLADFIVSIESKRNVAEEYCRKYISNSNDVHYALKISEDDVLKEKEFGSTMALKELFCIHRALAEWFPQNDAFLLHSVLLDVDGVGVAFAAKSGTGKTTHTRLWQQYLGDRMTIVNGDKPIIRFFDEKTALEVDSSPEKKHSGSTVAGIPYAYGNPWMGKEFYGCNMRTPLKHICFIERSETNWVEKIDKKDAVNRIFNQVYMPKDPVAVMKTMELIDRLLSSCKLWIIHCNMEPAAAETAYRAIFGE